MSGAILSTSLLAALAVVLVSAGIEDARTREIANGKNAVIAVLAPLWWWASNLALWPDIATQVGLALIVFGLFVAAFHFGWMGGGDVKMIGALALWLPLVPLMWMLIVMSLIGGAITALLLVERALRRSGGGGGGGGGAIEVPYGIAIAIAALFSLGAPLFNHFGVNA